MCAFVSRATNITSTSTGARTARVVFSKQFKQACTVCTEEPYSKPGRHAFKVHMPVKQGHTAIGITNRPEDPAYMTPDDRAGTSHYLSMGGAGFVYPEQRGTKGRYTEGDSVTVEVDVPEGGKGVVRWRVNDALVAETAWVHGLPVWPAISCRAGEVVCDVTFLTDP